MIRLLLALGALALAAVAGPPIWYELFPVARRSSRRGPTRRVLPASA